MYLDYNKIVVVFLFIISALCLGYWRMQNKYLCDRTISSGNAGSTTSKMGGSKITTVLFIIAAIPLLVYPAVLAASLMGLAANFTVEVVEVIENLFFTLILNLFYILTILYPITYIICGWFYLRKANKKLVYVPFIHIFICVLLFYIL